MTPSDKLIALVAEYQRYYELTFPQAVVAMRRDLLAHRKVLQWERKERKR